ncbi:MAG: hypothetical protein LBN23_00075 [Paludibacter sp.]|jgi:DNA-binding ferritin-like protein|nr:hypothetical protein [Paludibacter sp.]
MENHLIIGLGGTGGKVLKAFRKRLWSEFSDEERAKLPIGFVYVDSTKEMMNPDDVTFRVHGKNAAFSNSEFVNIKGVELNTVFKNPNGFPGIKGFLGDPEVMQKTIGSVGAAAGQKRRAGRILFGGSVQPYLSTLKTQYEKVKKISGNTAVNIHIFTGLAGGTGSGSVIDVIAQTRNLFPRPIKEQGANIVVYCMTPEILPPSGCDAGRYHANGYAALAELNALAIGKYLPHDVTAQTERINNNGANGIFLYTNVNEHGKVIESLEQLPVIVSDLIYSYIFLEQNKNTEDFKRAYTFENIDDYKRENNEKVKKDEIDIVRSKAFGSFGVKRVILPEEEIVEYFTYNFGRQALLQIRYNNWSDNVGFRDKPANVNFNAFVEDAEQLERWRMTDRHLMLDKPILTSDQKKWNGIADYWNAVVPAWTTQSATAKLPLNELEKYCTEGYDKFFRRVGVKNFYDGQKQAKDTHANEIIDEIEKYMFDKFELGDLSLHNLTELIDKLIESVGKRRKEYEGKITTWNQSIEQLSKALSSNMQKWSRLNLAERIVQIGKRCLQEHNTLLTQYYIKKTEVEGLSFGEALLASLKTKLESLRTRIESFVNTVNEAIDDTEKQAGARLQDSGDIADLQEAVIRFYNHDAVVKFTRTMEQDKKRQENLASEFRRVLLEQIGKEKTFAKANAEISKDSISQILEKNIREKSISIHDEILIENNEKLINRNILEQLSEKYNDDDNLKKFALELIQKSGVLLTFDFNEINRTVKNNEPPKPENIFKKVIMINLPKIEGNEKVQKFADKFQNALQESIGGDVIVKVDTNGSRKNEITIISITYCFPLRAIQDLKTLKEKYDFLISNPNVARQNRTVLHTEGTGENFPNLFVENDLLPSQIREKYTAYLIIAYALGIIKYGDRADGTGKSAFGTVEKNRLGREVLNPLANKFTEIPYLETFDESFGESLREKTEKILKADYLHIEKRTKLIAEIQKLYGDIIIPEFNGNEGSEGCRFFGNQAEKAMDIIEKS